MAETALPGREGGRRFDCPNGIELMVDRSQMLTH